MSNSKGERYRAYRSCRQYHIDNRRATRQCKRRVIQLRPVVVPCQTTYHLAPGNFRCNFPDLRYYCRLKCLQGVNGPLAIHDGTVLLSLLTTGISLHSLFACHDRSFSWQHCFCLFGPRGASVTGVCVHLTHISSTNRLPGFIVDSMVPGPRIRGRVTTPQSIHRDCALQNYDNHRLGVVFGRTLIAPRCHWRHTDRSS